VVKGYRHLEILPRCLIETEEKEVIEVNNQMITEIEGILETQFPMLQGMLLLHHHQTIPEISLLEEIQGLDQWKLTEKDLQLEEIILGEIQGHLKTLIENLIESIPWIDLELLLNLYISTIEIQMTNHHITDQLETRAIIEHQEHLNGRTY